MGEVAEFLRENDPLEKVAASIAEFEGFNLPDSLARRNNNPGNLKDPRTGEFRRFASEDDGWEALRGQIRRNADRGVTLKEFFGGKAGVYRGYAPRTDSNDPEQYAQFVAERVGASPDEPVANVLNPKPKGEVAEFLGQYQEPSAAPEAPGFLDTLGEGLKRSAEYTAQQIPRLTAALTAAVVNPQNMRVPGVRQVVQEPLVRPSLAIPEGGVGTEALRGVVEGIEGLASPENLAIGGALKTLHGIAALEKVANAHAALKGAQTAISAYFAKEMGTGAYETGKAAIEAVKAGDFETAARNLGLGSVESLFAVLAGTHAARGTLEGGRDIARRAKAAPPVEAKPETAPELQPEAKPEAAPPPPAATVAPEPQSAVAPTRERLGLAEITPDQLDRAAQIAEREGRATVAAIRDGLGVPAKHAQRIRQALVSKGVVDKTGKRKAPPEPETPPVPGAPPAEAPIRALEPPGAAEGSVGVTERTAGEPAGALAQREGVLAPAAGGKELQPIARGGFVELSAEEPGVPSMRVPVKSADEASAVVRRYIDQHELGSSTFSGGDIRDERGDLVARVSYNGRVWDREGKLLQNAFDDQVTQETQQEYLRRHAETPPPAQPARAEAREAAAVEAKAEPTERYPLALEGLDFPVRMTPEGEIFTEPSDSMGRSIARRLEDGNWITSTDAHPAAPEIARQLEAEYQKLQPGMVARDRIEAEEPEKPSPYPATEAEAIEGLKRLEAERRGKGIGPEPYAGKSNRRREAAFDRYMTAQLAEKPAPPPAARAKEPWEMTSDEWQAEIDAAKINFSGTGGESRYGMKRATKEGSFATGVERLRFLRSGLHDKDVEGLKIPAQHRDVVKKALRENRAVPPEVLAEYPELKPSAEAPPTPTAKLQAKTAAAKAKREQAAAKLKQPSAPAPEAEAAAPEGRAAIDLRVKAAKFTPGEASVPISGQEQPVTVKALGYRGLLVHRMLQEKESGSGVYEPTGKGYRVTHAGSGQHMGLTFDTQRDAKVAAVRMAEMADFTGKNPPPISELEKLLPLQRAIRKTGDPYAEVPAPKLTAKTRPLTAKKPFGSERGSFSLVRKPKNPVEGRVRPRFKKESTFLDSIRQAPRRAIDRISDEGTAGAELAMRLETMRDFGERDASKRLTRLEEAGFAKIKPGPNGTNGAEGWEIHDHMQGIAEAKSDAARAIAQSATTAFGETMAEFQAAGGEVRLKSGETRPGFKRRFYFPQHQLSAKELSEPGPKRADVVENLVNHVKHAKTPEEAAAMIDDFVDYLDTGGLRESIIKLTMQRMGVNRAVARRILNRARERFVTRESSLEFAREVDLPFYDPNPMRVLPDAIMHQSLGTKRIVALEQGNRKVDELVDQIATAGGDAEYVKYAVGRILGTINEPDQKLSRLYRAARAWGTLKMSTTALLNVTQGPAMAWTAGDFRAMLAGARHFTKAGRKFGKESGAAMEAIIHEVMRAHGAEKRWVGTYLRGIQMNRTEHWNRWGSAVAGADFVARMHQRLRRKPADNVARGVLKRYGLDPDEALKKKVLDYDELLLAGKKFSDRTQGRVGVQDLPLGASTEFGRMIVQFKPYGYNLGRLLAQETAGEIKRGHFGRGFSALLVAGTVLPITNAAYKAVRNLIAGRETDLTSVEFWLESAIGASLLGVATDAFQAARFRRLGEWVIGATPSTIVRGVEAAASGPKAFAKFAYREIPILGNTTYYRVFGKEKKKAKSPARRKLERELEALR